MYNFFFFTEEAFSLALEKLRKSDRNWFYSYKNLLISFYEGCDADFLVGELVLLGVSGGAYRLERPERKKGGTELKTRGRVK
ncbi:hypothetical protein A2380_01105 [candidate division WWE3 bacterium RIFOXYB1_FULL_43_24]|uniref:Uncharacterized protein n=2 Tax=Katanobacteria TaxID=422282 RepID=A0A0G0YS69_UNCKA|nr:MAG: hypothetical protein UU92_C0001G0064 [candidate division WWE3 bacterium GW2011_GWA1_42_12]KKS35195.1 MAG: hypothetical protein UU97_C0001G0046 [candidate division WWE3 bacterium GW2011_GWD1_42_14]KKS39454.1 MAG: hypothetical protein UV00_C0001G0022 [candidate division WWE3 bacterium GW2011_GWF1_42_14]KKS40897.1 MAG: hypothetical protein UV03_C0001G0022 [candidate division WWE3 bacterium GW2011_GWE1_42_16]KKS67281.1 MAG: hypothetical protein UV35_C0001G0049 [candidate division WWE3 bacte